MREGRIVWSTRGEGCSQDLYTTSTGRDRGCCSRVEELLVQQQVRAGGLHQGGDYLDPLCQLHQGVHQAPWRGASYRVRPRPTQLGLSVKVPLASSPVRNMVAVAVAGCCLAAWQDVLPKLAKACGLSDSGTTLDWRGGGGRGGQQSPPCPSIGRRPLHTPHFLPARQGSHHPSGNYLIWQATCLARCGHPHSRCMR